MHGLKQFGLFVLRLLGGFPKLSSKNNDWNQARLDRVLETRYLERIHADLLTDLGRIDRSENAANIRMRQVERLLGRDGYVAQPRHSDCLGEYGS